MNRAKNFLLLEKIFTVVFLFYSTGAWLQKYSGFWVDAPSNFEVDILEKTIRILSYLLIPILIGLHWQKFIKVVTKDIGLLLLVILAVTSLIWSVNPDVTFDNTRGLIRSSLWGVYLAIRYSLKEQLQLLACALGIAGVFSFILILFFPQYGIHQVGPHVGLWKGAFYHKNTFGLHMVLGANIFAILALMRDRFSWLLWMGFAMSVILVLFSGGKTSLLLMCILCLMIIIYKFIFKDKTIKINIFPFLITVVLSIIFLFHQVEKEGSVSTSVPTNIQNQQTEVKLKKPQQPQQPQQSQKSQQSQQSQQSQKRLLTMTGRIPMWFEVLKKFQKRPWLGYGYEAFWKSDESKYIRDKFPWARQPHNGYLEVLLNLGLIGLLMLGFSLVLLCWRAGKNLFYSKNIYDFWICQFILWLILVNISSSTLISPLNLFWVIYVATALTVSVEYQN